MRRDQDISCCGGGDLERQERLEICNKCPILDKKYMICDKALWLNPKTKRVSSEFKKGYYRGCGCRLKAKTTLIDEHCPAKLW